jgi:hypothetical protein
LSEIKNPSKGVHSRPSYLFYLLALLCGFIGWLAGYIYMYYVDPDMAKDLLFVSIVFSSLIVFVGCITYALVGSRKHARA